MKKDNRKAIIQATARLIVQNGVSDVTTPEIAEKAGVTQPLIHYHFEEGKKGLFYAAFEYIADNMTDDDKYRVHERELRAARSIYNKWLKEQEDVLQIRYPQVVGQGTEAVSELDGETRIDQGFK